MKGFFRQLKLGALRQMSGTYFSYRLRDMRTRQFALREKRNSLGQDRLSTPEGLRQIPPQNPATYRNSRSFGEAYSPAVLNIDRSAFMLPFAAATPAPSAERNRLDRSRSA